MPYIESVRDTVCSKYFDYVEMTYFLDRRREMLNYLQDTKIIINFIGFNLIYLAFYRVIYSKRSGGINEGNQL